MKPDKLETRYVSGAGRQIFACIPKELNFVEYTAIDSIMIATDQWVQFPNSEFQEMVKDVFEEMVALWNEKHANRQHSNKE